MSLCRPINGEYEQPRLPLCPCGFFQHLVSGMAHMTAAPKRPGGRPRIPARDFTEKCPRSHLNPGGLWDTLSGENKRQWVRLKRFCQMKTPRMIQQHVQAVGDPELPGAVRKQGHGMHGTGCCCFFAHKLAGLCFEVMAHRYNFAHMTFCQGPDVFVCRQTSSNTGRQRMRFALKIRYACKTAKSYARCYQIRLCFSTVL